MEKMRMRAWALAASCVLVVVLPSGQQQQASAMSEFCRCYTQCYPSCRQHHGSPFACKLLICWASCIGEPAATGGAGGCKKMCLESFCGGDPAAADDADADANGAACVEECTFYWNRHSNHTETFTEGS